MAVESWIVELDALMVDLADPGQDAYERSEDVQALALRHLENLVTATSIYLIIAELGDRYELGQASLESVQDELRAFATGWPPVSAARDTRSTYLDHWRYDICGYERPGRLHVLRNRVRSGRARVCAQMRRRS